jgi:hypothetical protein
MAIAEPTKPTPSSISKDVVAAKTGGTSVLPIASPYGIPMRYISPIQSVLNGRNEPASGRCQVLTAVEIVIE